MIAKYEYQTKKEVLDKIVKTTNQLKIELGLKTVFVPNFKFPLKNREIGFYLAGHLFSIENVGRLRYNLIFQ